jgi:hypothetical protein
MPRPSEKTTNLPSRNLSVLTDGEPATSEYQQANWSASDTNSPFFFPAQREYAVLIAVQPLNSGPPP